MPRSYVPSSANHLRWIENKPPAMVGDEIGCAFVGRLSRLDTGFHLNVNPQLKP